MSREVLWRPSAEQVAATNLARFRTWLAETRGLNFGEYETLWQWSVEAPEVFWRAVWDHFEVTADGEFARACSGPEMPGARWFEGARVNYAEHVLRHEAELAEAPALWHAAESRPMASTSWSELGRRVRAVAAALRALGVQPGDRCVAYMPNVPETVVAMLAVTAIGAVWAAAAPEFGAPTVVERFGQIAPKVLFACDGYVFNGRSFDRRDEVAAMVERLPSLETVVWTPQLGLDQHPLPGVASRLFSDIEANTAPDRAEFAYERVAWDHPLWVLFSSGTTGKPKAIAHSHAGIVAEHLKYMHLHLDLRPGDNMFFYTTTGWMIWNSVVSALMTGASAVLYDGSPSHGGVDRLWRLADDAGVTLFGASPTLVQLMEDAGLRPRDRFELKRLRSVILSGSPSTPETFRWFYRAVNPDLWVTSQSGGTELCSGLVGGVAERPVIAGEIQGRMLGMDVHAWDVAAREVVGEVGELVVTSPFPSMPLFFWGDENGERYREAYFSGYPGVWRHGDLIRIGAEGGCHIPGRSDATLNRYGVRIGVAEVYDVLRQVDGVADSLIVCVDRPDGSSIMPLFVQVEAGTAFSIDLAARIRSALRSRASPRHVPDAILEMPQAPYTLTGKKMEVPVRRILSGEAPEAVASPDAMANPASLAWFAEVARPKLLASLRAATDNAVLQEDRA